MCVCVCWGGILLLLGWVIVVSKGTLVRNLLLDHAQDASEVKKDVGAGNRRDIFAYQDFPEKAPLDFRTDCTD